MNEKGFMYPITLSILLLLSIFLTIQYNQYLTEKRFLKEIEQYEQNHFYFLQALKKVEESLKEEGYATTGSLDYEKATVSYNIIEMSGNILQVTFRLNSPARNERLGIGYYDKDLQRMYKWFEKG